MAIWRTDIWSWVKCHFLTSHGIRNWIVGRIYVFFRIHYGTWESAVYGLAYADNLRDIRAKLFKEKLPFSAPEQKRRPIIHKSDVVSGWCLPFLGSDRPVVMRSQRYLYEREKKRPIQMQAYIQFKYVHWLTRPHQHDSPTLSVCGNSIKFIHFFCRPLDLWWPSLSFRWLDLCLVHWPNAISDENCYWNIRNSFRLDLFRTKDRPKRKWAKRNSPSHSTVTDGPKKKHWVIQPNHIQLHHPRNLWHVYRQPIQVRSLSHWVNWIQWMKLIFDFFVSFSSWYRLRCYVRCSSTGRHDNSEWTWKTSRKRRRLATRRMFRENQFDFEFVPKRIHIRSHLWQRGRREAKDRLRALAIIRNCIFERTQFVCAYKASSTYKIF